MATYSCETGSQLMRRCVAVPESLESAAPKAKDVSPKELVAFSAKLSVPRLLIVATLAAYAFSRPHSGDQEFDLASGLEAAMPLRGCRGEPVNFSWDVPEDAPKVVATVGNPVRLKFLAFDSHGRRAQATACNQLAVSIDVGGSAQLMQNTSNLKWGNGELILDINDRVAEDVEVSLRLESLEFEDDRLRTLFTRSIRYEAGAPDKFEMSVAPILGSGRTGSAWVTDAVLEVAVDAKDSFGNKVPGSDFRDKHVGLTVVGSSSIDVMGFGRLELDQNLRPRALVRGLQPGEGQLWLQQQQQPQGVQLANATVRFVENKATRSSSELSPKDAEWQKAAEEVREAFLHAWRGYRRHAWGYDDLKPLSKQGRDSFGNIGMTVLDSLTTLHLMGLHKEFEQGAEFVTKTLDFDTADREISIFEITIRALGGLLGAHSLTGRKIFLQRAVELADRLLPALSSDSGLPNARWNIARQGGTITGEATVLAEAGSLQLEFRQLSAMTGDTRYAQAVDNCFNAIQRTGVEGTIPVSLTPPNIDPPRALRTGLSFGANADSYYEYLLKQWLQSPTETRFLDIFMKVMEELPTFVRPSLDSKKKKLRLLERDEGQQLLFKTDHLSCFVPGMIALGLLSLPEHVITVGDRNSTWHLLAEGIGSSCHNMWTHTKSGLAPEFVFIDHEEPYNIGDVPSHGQHSFLRPETVESLFYLHRLTGKNKYRKWGYEIFKAIVDHAKVDVGYASVTNVNEVPTTKMDDMQSFVMAETFKYLYLLFSPKEALDLDKYVLNTEAHPLRRPGPF